jgi:hypothetical protein
VVAAANKLKQSLDEVEKGKKGDQDLFKKMGKLTENNIFVPRILDVIHRTLADVSQPQVRDVKTGSEYVQLAKQTSRPQRGEIWIEALNMYYEPKTPELLFKETTPDKKGAPVSKPGWAVSIRGYSANPQLATWLEETLKPALEKNGRVPNRGIYVDQIALARVGGKKPPGKEPEPLPPTGSDDSASQGGRGGGRGRMVAGGEGAGSEESGPVGRGGRAAAEPAPGAPTPAGGTTADPITAWRNKARTDDILTGERIADDKQFTIYVIVRKGDTPANLIPEEFKPKKAEPDKGKAPDKAAPAPKPPKGKKGP